MPPTDTARKPAKVQQRTRADWGAAKARYVALRPTERSLARISRETGVHESTVQKWAKRDGWYEAARQADDAAAKKALANATRSIEQRNADSVKLTELLRMRAIEKIDEVDPSVAVRSLPRYMHLEQLIAGEATSRIDLGLVQVAFNAIVAAAAPFVPLERRGEYLDAVDGAIGGVVAIEGGRQ